MAPITVTTAERQLLHGAVELAPEVFLDMTSHGCTGCVVSEIGELLLRLAGVDVAEHVRLLADQVRREHA